MLIWKENIETKEEVLEILTELKKQEIKVYYLDWLGRVVINPRDKKLRVVIDGKTAEGIGPAMARSFGKKATQLLGIKSNVEFRKIWEEL